MDASNLFIIDTSAWIEYFAKSESGSVVKKYIESGHGVTPTIVLAELIFTLKKYGFAESKLTARLEFVQNVTGIKPLDAKTAILAGKINLERKKRSAKWGIVDSIILATTKSLGARIVTGDEDFRDLEGAIIIR